MTEETIVSIIIILLGGFQTLRPDLMLRFQVWTQRVFMSADYRPTRRTETIVRAIGAFILVLGILLLSGIIE